MLQAVPAMENDRLGRAVLDLAVALLRAGARALVAGGGGPLVGELQALGGEWTDCALTATGPLGHRRAAAGLRDLIRTERVDVVHAHGVDAAACAAAATRRSGAKFVTTYIGAPPPPAWRSGRQDAPARGDRVLAFSRFAGGLIEERYRTPPERIAVIPPSIDPAFFDPGSVDPGRLAALRSAWRIAPGERVVLAPGRLVASQGYLTLVDAFRLLVNGGLRRAVVVVTAQDAGDPTIGPAIDERAAAQGLAPAFRRVGACPDMPAAMLLADLVVIPTERASTFDVLAAEAQASGRPVVASDVGALPEMVEARAEDGSSVPTGWIVQPGDPLSLAQGIAAALSQSPEERDALEARARRAGAKFAPAQVARATLATYEGLLAEVR